MRAARGPEKLLRAERAARVAQTPVGDRNMQRPKRFFVVGILMVLTGAGMILFGVYSWFDAKDKRVKVSQLLAQAREEADRARSDQLIDQALSSRPGGSPGMLMIERGGMGVAFGIFGVVLLLYDRQLAHVFRSPGAAEERTESG